MSYINVGFSIFSLFSLYASTIIFFTSSNFDSSFASGGYNLPPEITIYSIVNSIIANGNVMKVQILVEGSSDVDFMGTFDLNTPFEFKSTVLGE